jgi:hypothetical protein
MSGISSPPDSGMSPEVEEAEVVLGKARDKGATARALGGVAIALRCPSAQPPGPLSRSYGDLDLVVDRSSASAVSGIVEAAGFAPEKRFNAAHGRTRMLFINAEERHLDLFVESFAMCHTLELRRRLTIDEQTLPLADLLLTKLQIARLTHKDVIDTSALLLDQPLVDSDEGLNVDYISGLLAQDWGWWRTVTENLGALRRELPGLGLDPADASVVEGNLIELLDAVEGRSKSLRWRTRARVGDRLPWRDEPEELS